jgi:hypothetical protein
LTSQPDKPTEEVTVKKLATLALLTSLITTNAAQGAIFLSLDSSGGELQHGTTQTFTVFLNVTAALPDPTNPFNSIPTPMTDFNFAVDLTPTGAGIVNITAAANDAAFTAGGSNSFTATQALFGFTGGNFDVSTGANQIALGTFTVLSVDNKGDVEVTLSELTAGNTPGSSADFIFENSSIPFGGDDQLFTQGGGGILSTPVLATITAIPEPSAAVLVCLGGLAMLRRRRS